MATGLAHLAVGDLAFDFPASWAVDDALPAATTVDVIAVVGTQPWGPCDVADINCHNAQRLEPGALNVEIDEVSDPAANLCTRALKLPVAPPGVPLAERFVRVAGRPAIFAEYHWAGADYYHSDVERVWSIAVSGTTTRWLVVDARSRGPGTDGLMAAVDGLVGSLVLPTGASGDGGPTDCGSPFPTR